MYAWFGCFFVKREKAGMTIYQLSPTKSSLLQYEIKK